MNQYRPYIQRGDRKLYTGKGALGCVALGLVFLAITAAYMALGGLVAMLAWNFILANLAGLVREISWPEGVGLWFVLTLVLSFVRGIFK